MLKHVGVLFHRRQQTQSRHERIDIFPVQVRARVAFRRGDELAQGSIVLRTVGEKEQLVVGVERNEVFERSSGLNELLPSLIDKDPLNEILTEAGVVEPAVDEPAAEETETTPVETESSPPEVDASEAVPAEERAPVDAEATAPELVPEPAVESDPATESSEDEEPEDEEEKA